MGTKGMIGCVVAGLGASLVGCGTLGDNEAMTLGCEETRTALTAEEVSALGFSAAEVMTNVEGQFLETLTWEAGGSSVLDLAITVDTSQLFYVDSKVEEPVEGETYTDAYPLCEPYVELGATVDFETTDGLFAESWDLKLAAFTADGVTFNLQLDPAELAGTYTFTALDPSEYDEVWMNINGEVMFGATSGEVYEGGEKVDGETASATLGLAGSWGAVGE